MQHDSASSTRTFDLGILGALAEGRPLRANVASRAALKRLADADLAKIHDTGASITDAGRAHLRRLQALASGVDPFLAQHADLAAVEGSPARINESESPLAWLVRRRGRDGRAMIEPHQFLAGEKLRAAFTRAQMTPRVTANWSAAVAQGRRGGAGGASLTEAAITAHQQVRQAADAVGPELFGVLLDVCCFLKKLDEVERERAWPVRSAKVVLQIGLERLARHYGLTAEARGRASAAVRTWLAEGAGLSVEG